MTTFQECRTYADLQRVVDHSRKFGNLAKLREAEAPEQPALDQQPQETWRDRESLL